MKSSRLFVLGSLIAMAVSFAPMKAARGALPDDGKNTVDQIELSSCLIYPAAKTLTANDISIVRPTAEEISNELSMGLSESRNRESTLPYLIYDYIYPDSNNYQLWVDLILNGQYNLNYIKRTKYLLVIRQFGAAPIQTQITKDEPMQKVLTSQRKFSMQIGTAQDSTNIRFTSAQLNDWVGRLMSGIQQSSDLIAQDIQGQIGREIDQNSINICK